MSITPRNEQATGIESHLLGLWNVFSFTEMVGTMARICGLSGYPVTVGGGSERTYPSVSSGGNMSTLGFLYLRHPVRPCERCQSAIV